jgi:hypothetical protein
MRSQLQEYQGLTAAKRIGGLARRQARAVLVLLVLVVAGGGMAAAQTSPRAVAPDPLAEARRLYNQGRYSEAIAAAQPLRDLPGTRPQALLLLGRAGLERYRQTADRADLVKAREALRESDASRLDGRDRLELVVGLGEALYLEESYGPAAEVFDSVVPRASELGPAARDQLLDWWATAVDRHAQSRATSERPAMYARVMQQMSDELRRDPGTAAASYWIAAAARATGDLDLAWNAAMAGWVRAQLTRDQGAGLRPDLDRLMLQGIIPDRARRLAAPTGELEQAIAGLASEWDTFKEKWTAR